MSALPGYINRGCVNTLFLSIRKHLNVRTSALMTLGFISNYCGQVRWLIQVMLTFFFITFARESYYVPT